MEKANKAPKFAVMKSLVTSKAIKQHKEVVLNPIRKDLHMENLPRNVPYVSSALFFKHNTALGPPYLVWLIPFSSIILSKIKIAKYPRFDRLPCTHKGTYVDDCIVDRVTQCINTTVDEQIPCVPIMYITRHKYSIERLPEATIGGAPRI